MRVLVTRAVGDAAPLVKALSARGHEPLHVPLLARRTFPDAVAQALTATPTPDVLLLTSRHAARLVGAVRTPAFRPIRVAAVGPATAAAARDSGFPVSPLAAVHTGAATVRALGNLNGLTLLFPRAAALAPGTRAALDRCGAELHEVVAYEHHEPEDSAARLVECGPVDIALCLSPSAVDRLDRLHRSLRRACPPVVVLGPTTASAAHMAGLEVAGVAAAPTIDALIDAVPVS